MTVSTRRSTLALLLGLFVLVLGVACGGNEEATGGGEQQANGGGGEEAAGIGDFADWDANNNDEINQQEFSVNVFENWDTNNDDEITQEEFNTGANNWFEDFDGNFNEWNTNNDEVLTQEEFNLGVADTDLFEGSDANNNGAIVENEFNDMSTQV